MAERSNASDSSSDLSGGAGSNPVGVIIKKTYSDTFYHSEVDNALDSKSDRA